MCVRVCVCVCVCVGVLVHLQSTRGGAHAVTVHQRHSSRPKDKNKSTQRQLTVMLVAVCVAAICLQLPYMIMYMVSDRRREWWPDGKGSVLYAWIYAGKEITEAVSIANHAVNFFLYCVSGSAFRRHVRKISLGVCRASGTSLVDASSCRTYCTSPLRQSTSPNIRLSKLHQQNVDADDQVIRLAD